jgi:hypothetical protein
MKSNQIKCIEMKLAVIGIGYVGLPLAVEFGKSVTLLSMTLILPELKRSKKVWMTL